MGAGAAWRSPGLGSTAGGGAALPVAAVPGARHRAPPAEADVAAVPGTGAAGGTPRLPPGAAVSAGGAGAARGADRAAGPGCPQFCPDRVSLPGPGPGPAHPAAPLLATGERSLPLGRRAGARAV